MAQRLTGQRKNPPKEKRIKLSLASEINVFKLSDGARD